MGKSLGRYALVLSGYRGTGEEGWAKLLLRVCTLKKCKGRPGWCVISVILFALSTTLMVRDT